MDGDGRGERKDPLLNVLSVFCCVLILLLSS